MVQSEGTLWLGRILTFLVVLFLIFDCGIKRPGQAVEATTGPGEHRAAVILFGLVVWRGIYLREPAQRALILLRITEPQPAAAKAQ